MSQTMKNGVIAILMLYLVIMLPLVTARVNAITISNVKVKEVTPNSATIEWSTNVDANGKVKYGKTSSLGFTERHDDFTKNHTLTLTSGIDTDTAYLFSVESADAEGNVDIENNSNNFYTFRTGDIVPPEKVANLRIVSATTSSVYIAWDAVNANDFDHYNIYRDRLHAANTTLTSFNDTTLDDGGSFSYKVSAVDKAGNEGPQSDTVVASTNDADFTAPVIKNVDSIPVTDTTARVSWTTNEDSTSHVFYGINKADNAKSDSALVSNHSVMIDNLVKNSKYMFIVKSCDASGNCANLSGIDFVAGADITPAFINASIPRYVNRRVIDIAGSTEPFSSVELFVNDMNSPRQSLSSSETGSGGIFYFSQVQLQQDNKIKIAVTDKVGNKNEKTFDVSVDTNDPVVKLDEIPSIISRPNLTISGTVDEPVTIKVFADENVNDTSIPGKITGLNYTKLNKNSVELRWNESTDNDFSHYVIYRNDRAIAITRPVDFNLFIDALVDSGKTYTYQISVVNIAGVEGPKSEPLVVTTPAGGAVINIEYHPVEIFPDSSKPIAVANASNKFNFGVRLSKGDGIYNLRIVFEDRASNTIVIKKTVVLDTKRPDIKMTSPMPGAFLFENVANEVDLIGKTEAGARIHLFVNRVPFISFDQSLEVSGIPDEEIILRTLLENPEKLDDIKEPELDAKCRFNIGTKSFCSTGADFSVDADNEGNFRFDKVDLTASGFAGRIREVPVTEFKDVQLNQENRNAKKTTLLLIATDKSGLRKALATTVSIGTCWSGNQSWSVIPLTQHQSPTFLRAERIAEGTEILYFFFNYSYIGRGANPRIKGISLSKACGTRELLDPRFNISCQIMPSGEVPRKLNAPDNTVSYSAMQLSRFPGMENFLENDWKSFLKSINNELTFPFKVRIIYEHEIIDDDGRIRTITETQTTCEQISYVMDSSLIDPRKVLPDFMLYDFVDYLQSSIKTLTQIQEQLNQLIDYVAVACLSSYGANLAMKIYRTWVELAEEAKYNLQETIKFSTGDSSKDGECENIVKAVQAGYGKVIKLKHFSDPDLKKCFPSIYRAWENEAKAYKLQRWSCDRIFGHSAPSKWTETKTDLELHETITTKKTCDSDEDIRGLALYAESCRTLVEKYFPRLGKDYGLDDKCFMREEENLGAKQRALYKLGNPVQGDIYEITREDGPSLITVNYVIKKNERNYITAQPETCAQLCGLQEKPSDTVTGPDGQQYTFQEGKIQKPGQKPEDQKSFSSCVTVNQCREWHERADPEKGGIVSPAGDLLKNPVIERKGYAKGCFYDGTNPSIVDRTNANTRKECCCIIGNKAPKLDVYYEPEDKDPNVAYPGPNPIVHESKTVPDQPPQPKPDPNAKEGESSEQKYSDMKWSYRYSRIGYLGKKYNPNRYTEGRDLPACFGQDNLFYKLFDKEDEVLIVDPFKQQTAALQCLYLTGINQRLQMYKNIMTAMSNCLIEIRTTGRADSGVCKELFTQHVCGAIWQGIRWFVDGCAPEDPSPDAEAKEEGVGEKVKRGFKGIVQGISESQEDFMNEYGNAKLSNLLGTGQESVARKVCLAAFGYDWEISARNLVDAAYTTPFSTLVQAVTRSREFLTIDPVSLRPRYEYRASWIINPGCDLQNYKLELACVSRKEIDQHPNSINCGAVGSGSLFNTGSFGTSTAYTQCDCLNLNQEVTRTVFNKPGLKQNVLVEEDYHTAPPIEDNYRYDHLKFTLLPDRRITQNLKQSCFPSGYEDGVFYYPIIDKTARDITDCTIDPLSGVMSCAGAADFFSKKGIVQLLEVYVNDENIDKYRSEELEFKAGEMLRVGAKVSNTGANKCIRVSLSPDPKEPVYWKIDFEGVGQIPPLNLDKLEIAGTKTGIEASPGIAAKLLSQKNQNIVDIPASFIDNPDKNKPGYRQYSEDDKVIIEGMQVDMSKKDVIQENADVRVIVRSNADASRPSPIIEIEEEGVVLQILDVTYNDKLPDREDDLFEGGGNIRVHPVQQSNLQDQVKTLTIDIFGLKEGAETFYGGEDCNLNDKLIQPRTYRFKVSKKGVEAGALPPVISTPKIEPRKQTIGKPVTISARITHSTSIKSYKIEITGPNGFKEEVDMQKNGDEYSHIFVTDTREAGKYTGDIKAVSKEGTPANQKFDFELVLTKEQQAAALQETKNNLMGTGSISTLTPETQQAFDNMKKAAKDEANIDLDIVSGHRTFDRQKDIWNAKVTSGSGTEEQKVAKASESSAVPGMSRHHWGTDIDINSVDPADFASGGRYVNAYNWLKLNAARFDFCQPYDRDRGVVKIEQWHWSYKPQSRQMMQQHTQAVTADDMKGKGIEGEATIIADFEKYHKGFVSDINPECLSSQTASSSQQEAKTGDSTLAPAKGACVPIQTSPNAKINYVFVYYGQDEELKINGKPFSDVVKEVVGTPNQCCGLAYVEPYASNIGKFNFYYINKPMKEPYYLYPPEDCTEERRQNNLCAERREDAYLQEDIVKEIAKDCEPDYISIMYPTKGYTGGGAMLSSHIYDAGFDPNPKRNALIHIHEFSHVIADIGDEYFFSKKGDLTNREVYCNGKFGSENCIATPSPNIAVTLSEAQSKWSNFIGQGEGCFKVLDPSNHRKTNWELTGGHLLPEYFHATPCSIMNFYNIGDMPEYNAQTWSDSQKTRANSEEDLGGNGPTVSTEQLRHGLGIVSETAIRNKLEAIG